MMATCTNWRHKAACLDCDPELFFPWGRPVRPSSRPSARRGCALNAPSPRSASHGRWTPARTPACGAAWAKTNDAPCAAADSAAAALHGRRGRERQEHQGPRSRRAAAGSVAAVPDPVDAFGSQPSGPRRTPSRRRS